MIFANPYRMIHVSLQKPNQGEKDFGSTPHQTMMVGRLDAQHTKLSAYVPDSEIENVGASG